MRPVVPMTYAVGMGPLPDLLEAFGGSRAVDRAFDATHLPLHLVTDRAHRIPLSSLVDLFERSASLAGDPLFGLKVGARMEPLVYGRFARYTTQAPTLRRAIERLIHAIAIHQIGGNFELAERSGGLVSLRYWQDARMGAVTRQHDDHILHPVLCVARLYLGDHWSPMWIESGHLDRRGVAAREDETGISWRSGAQGIGLVFKASELDARRQEALDADVAVLSSSDIRMEVAHRTAERPIERITGIIALRLMDGDGDIDGAARMAGLGRRSLQRVIQDEGTTYRALLGHVRMSRARALMRETDYSLTEIAQITGYSDLPHFSRAFRRSFGVAPSGFRTAAPTA